MIFCNSTLFGPPFVAVYVYVSPPKWSQICHDKTTFLLKTDPNNKFLKLKNGLIVCSSSSSTLRHTSTRSCYDIFRSLWELSVPTFRIFEDFRGFWLGTSNIYPGCLAKNILDFTMNFFFKKSKIGHGGPTQYWILRRTTVTDFDFLRKNIFIVSSHMFSAGHPR